MKVNLKPHIKESQERLNQASDQLEEAFHISLPAWGFSLEPKEQPEASMALLMRSTMNLLTAVEQLAMVIEEMEGCG